MDSSMSDMDSTVNLDDSEWAPSDGGSDDDSIEIVGEVTQSVRRITRSARPVVKSSTPAVVKRGQQEKRNDRENSFKSRRSSSSSSNRQDATRKVFRSSNSSLNVTIGSEDLSSPQVRGRGSRRHVASPHLKRKRSEEDGDCSIGAESSQEEFKTPTSVGKRRPSQSRVSRKNSTSQLMSGKRSKVTDRRGLHGPPLGAPITDRMKTVAMRANSRGGRGDNSPSNYRGRRQQPFSINISSSRDDSDIFIDLPDPTVRTPEQLDAVTVSDTNSSKPNVLLDSSHTGTVSEMKSEVSIGNKKYDNLLIHKEIAIAPTEADSEIKRVKSESVLDFSADEFIFECLNKKDKVDENKLVQIEPSVVNTPPLPSRVTVSQTSSSRVQSSNLVNEDSVVKRESIDLLDTSCVSNSSFDSTPVKPKLILKKRLSLLKKAKRVSIKGAVTKLKSTPAKLKSAPVKRKIIRKPTAIDPDIEILFEWDPASVISERQGVSEWQARQVISLFDQECTLPFIARYRREKTGNMDIDKLREVQNAYQQLKDVKQKVSKVIQDKPQELSLDTRISLLNATTVQEVKALTASLSTKGKRTLADRARKLGLSEAAETLLSDANCASDHRWVHNLVAAGTEGRSTVEEIETGLKHILADIIRKDAKMLAYMKTGLKRCEVMLQASRARQVKSQEKADAKPKKVIAKRQSLGGKKKPVAKPKKPVAEIKPDVIAKYENYFNFSNCAWRTRSHMVCALNRGEQHGILSIKVTIPGFAYTQFTRYCADRWLGNINMGPQGYTVPYRRKLILDMLPDCWDRLVMPALQSWVRSELSDAAELASIEVFASNLRRLFLTPPVRANTVLALDPGFHNGCKVAVVERKGKVLAVDTIYPFGGHQNDDAIMRLRQLVLEYRCNIVCIGNGTACRETESWLSMLIRKGAFEDISVQYTIINESGASQYSVTPEARTEFPDMDINHISAVSLARRLQDPLLEYIKVPAMHLGVGMYQHDVSTKLLTTSLDSVVMECVSFVGVDLNVASEVVLRKVSGLNKARAAAIVKHRDQHGTFRSREELKKVKGIGPVSFQQCAGFVKIVPQTLRQQISNSNLTSLCELDSTTVHPESYDVAKKLVSLASLKLKDIGSSSFITSLRMFVHGDTQKDLSNKCNCSVATIQTILESLYQPLDFDFRAQFDKPLFRKGVTSMEDLKCGEKLQGSVRNVTPFGAFVDIGVGQDGLVHISKMRGQVLQLGNTVFVEIMNVDVPRKRIGLLLLEVVG